MQVPEAWELPEKIIARLGLRTAGGQRAVVEEGHLLLVLHQPPKPDDSQTVGVYFWRAPGGSWHHSGRGNGIACLREHVEQYRACEDRLERMYESASCASDYFAVLEQLVPLQRAARNQATALQSARDSIAGDRELIQIRDEAGEIDRAMEILYTDTKNALEFDTARSAEAQAKIAHKAAIAGHRLNVLAAMFFPLTAVASVLGVNMPLGVEDAPTWMTWAVISVGIAVGAALLAWVLQSDERPE